MDRRSRPLLLFASAFGLSAALIWPAVMWAGARLELAARPVALSTLAPPARVASPRRDPVDLARLEPVSVSLLAPLYRADPRLAAALGNHPPLARPVAVKARRVARPCAAVVAVARDAWGAPLRNHQLSPGRNEAVAVTLFRSLAKPKAATAGCEPKSQAGKKP